MQTWDVRAALYSITPGSVEPVLPVIVLFGLKVIRLHGYFHPGAQVVYVKKSLILLHLMVLLMHKHNWTMAFKTLTTSHLKMLEAHSILGVL
jgi:hypothetical protein